jgi:hypothetical protein
MTWAKAGPAVIAVACLLVIIANTPAVLVDPLALAVAQIRQNAAKTDKVNVSPTNTEIPYPEETLAPKKTTLK